VFASLIAKRGGSALVLAHRDELLRQAAEKIAIADPTLALGVGFVAAQRDDVHAPVVVGSVQTLARADRLARLPRRFDTVVVDEGHHVAARSYRRILEHLSPAPLILGVTATPARADGKQLGDVWQEIVYQRGIAEMIRAGYLADIRGVRVGLERVKLDDVEQSGGDFDADALGKVLERASAPLHVLAAYRQHATGRKAIIFVPTVALAHRMAAVFREAEIRAEALDGTTPREERRAILARLHTGETCVVANVAVLGEGVDVPSIDAVILATPTRSQVKYTQCLDRDTEVLTPGGWKRCPDVREGDEVGAVELDSGEFSWQVATEKVERLIGDGERMFELQSPSIDLRVTGGHRMAWRGRTMRASKRRALGPWRFSTAEQLAQRPSEYEIPVAGHQDVPGVPLTDDELRFIGWFLTDGTMNPRQQIFIGQSERYPEHIEAIERCLKGCGFRYGRSRSEYPADHPYRAHGAQVRFSVSRGAPKRRAEQHLRGCERLAPYIDKNLAPALENVNKRQLGVLLEAVHLGDGAKQLGQSWTRRSYHITTANRVFADRLQSLCVRRGFRCNVSFRHERLMVLHIKEGMVRHVGGAGYHDRPSLVEVPVVSGERVWCVTNRLGTIVVRRNGKVAVVGNCLGRGLRTFPGKEDCLVIDVVGASERLDLQTLPRLFDLRDVPAPEVTVTEALERAALEKTEIDRRRALEHQNAGERAAATGKEQTPDGELRSRPVSMLAARRRTTRRLRWLRHRECWLVSLGATGTLALVPDGSRWRVLRLHGAKHDQLASGVDLGYAHGIAEDYVRAAGAQALSAPHARWRANPMNEAQANLLRRLGIRAPEGANRGEASDLITIARAAQLLDRLVEHAA
jgi:superfamily II DNA or RNA helicase